MASWLRRPDGAAAWLVLLVAVFNFTPALFTSGSLTESSLWIKFVKDVPLLVLVIVLVMHRGPAAWAQIARGLRRRMSPRQLSAVLRRDAEAAELMAALALGIVLLAAFMALSITFVASPSQGVLVSARYYLAYPALAIALAYAGPLHVQPLALGVVFLGGLQTVVEALDMIGVWGPTFYFGHFQAFGYIYPRAIGTLGNPNNLGIFLAFAAIIVASTGWHRLIRGKVAVAVLFAGIAMTLSKTAVIALALSYAATAWARMRRNPITLFLALTGLLVLVILMMNSRLGSATTPIGSFGSRGDNAGNALADWVGTPSSLVLGNGFDAETAVDATGAIRETVVDNMILALALEGGLVGVLLFASMILLATRLLLLPTGSAALSTVSRRYAAFFLIYTPLAVNFRLFPGALFFWVLVGLTAGAALRNGRPPASGPGESKHVREGEPALSSPVQ